MKKIIYSIGLLLLVILFTSVEVKAEETKMVDVTIKATFDESNNDQDLLNEPREYGSPISVDANTVVGEYEFAFWIVDGLIDLKREATTTFTATNNLTAIAVFTPINTPVLVFVDHSGKFIESQYKDYHIPTDDLPNKVNFEHDGWKTLIGSFEEETITENTVLRLQYKLDEETKKVTINNEEYLYNEVVTLTLEEGKTYWEENGEVVAYGDYTFSALYDRTLVAKSGKEEEVLVTLSDDLELREGYVSRVGQVHVPENYTLLEAGYLLGKTPLDLSIDNYDKLLKGTIVPHTNEFLTSINKLNYYPYMKGYAILRDFEDNLITIYTDKQFLNSEVYLEVDNLEIEDGKYNLTLITDDNVANMEETTLTTNFKVEL
ncbi:MAG: hypothetical protein WC907_05480, partial [Acholeplasmataceae bacterium]